MTKGQRLESYNFNRAMLYMLSYQVISKGILILGGVLFRFVAGTLLWSLDRPAITSGDLPYFFRSWQGWILILCVIVALLVYLAVDINMTILLSHKLLRRERIHFKELMSESFQSIKRFISLRGLLIVMYITVIAPLVGAPFELSITRNLVIPDFIMSFVNGSTILKIIYIIVVLALLAVGFIYMFVFNYITVEKLSTKDAMRSSKELMKKKWKFVLKEYVVFLAKGIAILLLILFFTVLLPANLLDDTGKTQGFDGFLVIMCAFLYLIAISLYIVFFLSLNAIKITEIFGKANQDKGYGYQPIGGASKRPWIIGTVSIVLIIGVVSGCLLSDFDEMFPPIKDVKIIAHRGGGKLAHENTVYGVMTAYEYGAYGTETDVQRTKDGQYIINHDDDFSRLCGVDKKPSEMDLSEIKQLKVKYESDASVPGAPVPTASEFLDAAKDKLTVYLELKGPTADRQMADDMYKLVKSKGMINQCVFIGLDYDLIKYMADTYEDATTGYLCFFSFGEIEDLDVDILMPEMETATSDNVVKINDAGKKADIWTVNSQNALYDFLNSEVDGIVTDNVDDAQIAKSVINEYSYYFRVMKGIFD